MRLLVAVLFAQLLGCNVLGGLLPLAPNRVLDCDDPETEAAAKTAVDYINSHHAHGYKFTVNQIEEVKVLPRRPSGEIIFLELDLLETKCHVLSPTPVEDCPVRPLAEHAVEGDCDVKVLKLDGIFTVLSHNCKSKPDSAEDVADVCPKCPLLAPLNDTQVVQGVETLVLHINSQDDHPFHQLHEIGRARIWTVPENAVELEFVVAATNCTTQDAKDSAANCVQLSGADAQFSFCVGTVKTNAAPEDNVVNCTSFKPQIGASDPSTPHQQPVVNPAVVVHSHGHHHLTHAHLDSSSGESHSSEMVVPIIPSAIIPSAAPTDATADAPIDAPADAQTAAPADDTTAANVIVKRSVAREPVVPAAAPVLPVCPGRVRFFK